MNTKLLFCFLLLYGSALFAQEPLLFYNGNATNTVAEWESRREEIKHLVLANIYGYMPGAPKWSATVTKDVVLESKRLRYKEVDLQLYKDDKPTIKIRLSLFIPFIPANKHIPVPVVLAINKCGNPEVIGDTIVTNDANRVLHPYCQKRIDKNAGNTESLRGTKADFWAIDTVLQRGYAFATFHESDIAADLDNFEQGIFSFYPELRNDTGWALISAWAWGLQRAVDYLVTDKDIDSSRIILFGHSRRGKAALLATALDKRVAMVVPHQSGTGGMALSKKHPMESVAQINRTFPHWFNTRFKTYAGRIKKLPLDQHYLLALLAPRPVIETIGTKDIWSSYWLSYKTLKLVSPVYSLYGKQGLAGKGKVSKRVQFNDGDLVQVRRPYSHTMNADYWSYILDFADLKLPHLK